MTQVQDVLKAKGKPDLIVVGSNDAGWLIQPADFSGPVRELSPEDAVAYKVDSAPKKGTDAAGWQRLAGWNADGTRAQQTAILPERPQSPEERFAAGTATPVTSLDEHGRVFTPTPEQIAAAAER